MKNLFQKLIAAIILFGFPFGFYYYYKHKLEDLPKQAEQVQTFWDAPAFKYATPYGDSLSSDSLKGKIYVADFIFTNCQSFCPDLSRTMAQLQETFKGNDNVKLVSFSIDPARDSLAALKQYAENYGAIRGKWYFLRGDTSTIWNTIEKGFKVSVGYQRDTIPPGYDFTHTDRLVLVDANGKIRGLFHGTGDEKDQIDSLNNSIAKLMVGMLKVDDKK